MLYSLDLGELHETLSRTRWLCLRLNLLNYVDRSVLFAVQPLVQSEFRLEQYAVDILPAHFCCST